MSTPNANGGRVDDSDYGAHSQTGEEPRVVVRDRRRIDPETGQVRPSGPDAAESAEPGQEQAAGQPAAAPATGRHAAVEEPPSSPEVDQASAELRGLLDERTADLKRLTAEYANYRKRMDRDREAAANHAKAALVTDLLSVLDDIERAAAHGDLTGAFKAVADKIGSTLQRAGLEPFGHEGEEFDPSVHEAVQHDTSPEVSGPTVTAVLRRGYKFGDRVVRAALVGVTDHEPGAQPPPAAAASTGSGEAGQPAEQSAEQH